MAGQLIHTIYSSRAADDFNVSDLEPLMNKARQYNATAGLTGMLLHCEGTFFQVLEGQPEDVQALFEKISKDPRHDNIVKIIEEGIAERSFGDWSMGLMNLTTDELNNIEGFNDFFQTGACLAEVDHGRSRKLLSAFAAGRWRVA